jgi:hypothetical protein
MCGGSASKRDQAARRPRPRPKAPKIFRRIFISKNFQPAAQASFTPDPETLRDGRGPRVPLEGAADLRWDGGRENRRLRKVLERVASAIYCGSLLLLSIYSPILQTAVSNLLNAEQSAARGAGARSGRQSSPRRRTRGRRPRGRQARGACPPDVPRAASWCVSGPAPALFVGELGLVGGHIRFRPPKLPMGVPICRRP